MKNGRDNVFCEIEDSPEPNRPKARPKRRITPTADFDFCQQEEIPMKQVSEAY